jgi:hypothetical protein
VQAAEDGWVVAAEAVPGAQVAAEGRVDVELLQARERVEKRVVVVVRVVAAAVERELVAVEVERVDEVPVAAPRAVPCGGCREAALEQVVHVAPQRRLGWIDGGEAEQRGVVEARRVERRRRRQRLPRGSGRHDTPERGGEGGRAEEHDEYEHRERAPQRPLHRRRRGLITGSELHRGARMSEWRGRRVFYGSLRLTSCRGGMDHIGVRHLWLVGLRVRGIQCALLAPVRASEDVVMRSACLQFMTCGPSTCSFSRCSGRGSVVHGSAWSLVGAD